MCKKELDLDFQAGVKDISGNNVHVEAFNVTIHNGIACFYGDGALVVPRFANVDLGKRIHINIRYFLHNPYSKHKGRQALLYNGDCDLTSTMVVAVDSDGSYFGMSNDRGFYKHVVVENNSKKVSDIYLSLVLNKQTMLYLLVHILEYISKYAIGNGANQMILYRIITTGACIGVLEVWDICFFPLRDIRYCHFPLVTCMWGI